MSKAPDTNAPGPKGNLIWGSLSEFQSDSLGLLSRSARDYGDIVRLRFGPIIAHLVNHPDHVEHVLLRNADRYDKKTRSVGMIKATTGDSLLSDDEDAWARHRRLIQPVFQPKYMESIGDMIDLETDKMLARWDEKSKTGRPVEIVSEMMHLVIAVSAKVLFDADIDSVRLERALEVVLADTWRRLESLLDPSMISPKFHRRAFKNAVAEIDDIVYEIIKERRKSSVDRDDLLSRLLRAHDGESDSGLSDLELRDAAVTLLLAGHETTANALAWAFYEVAKSPEKELQKCDPDDLFSETIRMYPSIWIIERRAKVDDQIGPYKIPKGTSVMISPYILHRNSEFWPDADTFDPSRYTKEVAAGRPRNAYIPFGLGQHRCVGLHMARRVSTQIMSRVYSRFNLRLVPGQSTGMSPGITLRHAGELNMHLDRI